MSREWRTASACAVPHGVDGHEVVLDGEVERVSGPREPHLPHRLTLHLGPNLRQRRHLGEQVERLGELDVEELGCGETVHAPPRGGTFGLLGGVVGELDAKGQCFARIRANTSSAGTPVPGLCFRIDAARKP
jgi:hypothetical protein